MLQDPVWQLVAEFAPPGEPRVEQRLAKQVTGAVQELGLQPTQVKRIRQAVQGAVRNATKRRYQEQRALPVIVRIWISGAYAQDRSQPSADAQQNGQQACCAWGFFLVQRLRDSPQVAYVEPHHLIEVYLYQEKAHADKGSRL